MKYMVKIDPNKMRNVLRDRGLTQAEVSEAIGKSTNYISCCLCNREISTMALELIRIKYGISIKEISPEKKKEPEKKPDEEDSPTGFSLSLLVRPDRVRVGISHNGEEIYSAWSVVKGDTEKNLIQAISYAAHMCYKKAEQRELEGAVWKEKS